LRDTGYEDWHDWSLANWGTKWDASAFRELASTPNAYDWLFATAWTVPVHFLEALARRFPLVTGHVFAVEEGNDFGYVGAIAGAELSGVFVQLTPDLLFLVYAAAGGAGSSDLSSSEPGFIARTYTSRSMRISSEEQAAALIDTAWRATHADLSAATIARIRFGSDIEAFLEWRDQFSDDHVLSREEAHEALGRYVRKASSVDFLMSERRTTTAVDRHVLGHLAAILSTPEFEPDQVADRLEAALAPTLDRFEKPELLDWAEVAMWRETRIIKARDPDTLRHSVIRMSRLLATQALDHLERTGT
jgi:hypothetical protein